MTNPALAAAIRAVAAGWTDPTERADAERHIEAAFEDDDFREILRNLLMADMAEEHRRGIYD